MLLQNGQPAAYASSALTPTETQYPQIEKELLAIMFACERFDAYIYGLGNVNVETDHKSLEGIVLKPLNSATQQLQRIHLKTYDVNVKYKKGQDMFLANTLSTAFIPEGAALRFVKELVMASSQPRAMGAVTFGQK